MADGTVALTWGHLISCFLSPPVRPQLGWQTLGGSPAAPGQHTAHPTPKTGFPETLSAPQAAAWGPCQGRKRHPLGPSQENTWREIAAVTEQAGTPGPPPHKGDPHSRADQGWRQEGGWGHVHHPSLSVQGPVAPTSPKHSVGWNTRTRDLVFFVDGDAESSVSSMLGT